MRLEVPQYKKLKVSRKIIEAKKGSRWAFGGRVIPSLAVSKAGLCYKKWLMRLHQVALLSLGSNVGRERDSGLEIRSPSLYTALLIYIICHIEWLSKISHWKVICLFHCLSQERAILYLHFHQFLAKVGTQ